MDKWIGVFFVLLSIVLIVLSQQMPEPAHMSPFASPGMLPTIIAFIILVLGLVLTVKNLPKNPKDYKLVLPEWSKLKEIFSGGRININENIRIVSAFIIIALYVFLLGRINYYLLTIIFLTIFMLAFKATSWYKVILISVVFSVVVGQVFTRLFLIPLP
jgi:hypothetical protein